MGTRRRAREMALQALYRMELTGDDTGGSTAELWRHFDEPEAARAFAMELVHGVLAHRSQIDALIGASSEHWRLGRLPQVDRNVLRVATYELLCRRDIPTSVVIDEAIEIARRFGSTDSPVFVNGVLDQVAATLGVKEGRGAL
jgi:N utilization substance protein B